MAFAVTCPECGSALEIEDEHRDWTVRCPTCRHEFRPVSTATVPVPVPEPDDDEFDDRPRRRPRRRREYGDPAKGREAIARPALALEMTGWISLVLSLVGSAFFVIMGFMLENQPPANPPKANEDPPELFIFIGFCFGIFAVPYFAAIGIGARKMRNHTSYGWAMTSAIMAVAAIVLFGVCGLPIIAPGIWAIVVLSNEDAKAAFNRKKKPVDNDDDFDD